MAKVASLYETRNFYRNFLDLTKDLSFEEWNALPRAHKAVALYLQFFNEIVLAWEKANTIDFINCEDGVEIVNQYLEKNVSIIEQHPERFTARYIYKVAYNCMYCICHDRKCDKERLENETSAIVNKDGQEYDLTSTATTGETADGIYETESIEKEFWAVIEDNGMEAEKVMRYLLSNNAMDLKKLAKQNKAYAVDPLRDIQVSMEEAQGIIERLREAFSAIPANTLLGQKMLEMGISFT